MDVFGEWQSLCKLLERLQAQGMSVLHDIAIMPKLKDLGAAPRPRWLYAQCALETFPHWHWLVP